MNLSLGQIRTSKILEEHWFGHFILKTRVQFQLPPECATALDINIFQKHFLQKVFFF